VYGLKVYTFNSTELRRVGVELMVQGGSIGQLGEVRRSSRAAKPTGKSKAITKLVTKKQAVKKGQVWVIPTSEENIILEHCV
jgi:hypothetical protein